MDVSRFRSLIGEPLINGDVENDWSQFESEIGVDFPADYKNFISAYGPCCLSDQLLLFHPKGEEGDWGLNLRDLIRNSTEAYSALVGGHPEMYPYPIYPQRLGGIPVGRTSGGNHLLIVPPASVDGGWEVLVDMGEWAHFEMSFTDFLWLALREELFVPVIEGDLSYEVVGGVTG
ncbi:SMI1/KNR4 family protein [Streptomyces fildesensis]|uniref:SMI1/KNR4 family protein n=1 Tax=Streptomyces fildesensis TaxID=375757 RepID=A0ABW8CKE5_9ACTN